MWANCHVLLSLRVHQGRFVRVRSTIVPGVRRCFPFGVEFTPLHHQRVRWYAAWVGFVSQSGGAKEGATQDGAAANKTHAEEGEVTTPSAYRTAKGEDARTPHGKPRGAPRHTPHGPPPMYPPNGGTYPHHQTGTQGYRGKERGDRPS